MRKILLIDDSEKFYRYFSDVLKGYEILWARDGEKGIEVYKKYKPDVVVVDLVLPDSSGLRVIKKIRSMDRRAKIIVVSGIDRIEVIRDALKAGACDYINKKSGIGIYREKIKKHMEN